MGRAMDAVLAQVTNQVALTAVTVAPGDTLQVRNFDPPANAYLESIIFKGGQSVTVRVLSPLFHDAVRGITFISAQAPTQFTLPREAGQKLQPQDVLTLQALSGGANSSAVVLQHYYENVGGASARLVSWADIAGNIANIKPQEIDVAASATIGAWNDTAMTTTENILKANTDYAVLGYVLDVACCALSIKGADTGNLRVAAPGTVLQDTTQDYFIELSEESGRPHIPVINSANAPATFVSVADNAASTAVKVQLILAQLTNNLPAAAA